MNLLEKQPIQRVRKYLVDLNLERGGFVSEIYDEIMFS